MSWNEELMATTKQRQSLHRSFAHLVAHPEKVKLFTNAEADSFLAAVKRIAESRPELAVPARGDEPMV